MISFNSESDFEYLSGDLSSIQIDNGIMPLRTDDEKTIMRGMDVAFLMEAIEERRRACGLSSDIISSDFDRQMLTFENKLNHVFLRDLETRLRPIYQNKWWYIGEPKEITLEYLPSQHPSFYSDWPQQNMTLISGDYIPTDFTDQLLSAPIMSMFDNVADMVKLQRPAYNIYRARLSYSDSLIQSGTQQQNEYTQSEINARKNYYCSYAFSGVGQNGHPMSLRTTTANDYGDAVSAFTNIEQVKDSSNSFCGRIVIGRFYTHEGWHNMANLSAFTKGCCVTRVISDASGNVTNSTIASVIENIRTSGLSQFDFHPPGSAFNMAGGGDYLGYIYINSVWVFDTLRDRTRWDI